MMLLLVVRAVVRVMVLLFAVLTEINEMTPTATRNERE
jgi:hypothetical protein